MATARLEIVTHRRELPPAISQHYGVQAEKVAESQFYTVFRLDTFELGDEDSGADLLADLEAKREIISHAWSRPVKIQGYTGRELLDRFRQNH